MCKSIQRVTKAYPACFSCFIFGYGQDAQKPGRREAWRGFPLEMLSDNKVICDKFKLAKSGGIGSALPNLSVRKEITAEMTIELLEFLQKEQEDLMEM